MSAYPSWWRERYGADQEAFVEELGNDHRRLGRAVIDLAVGALRVRLSPSGMPQSVEAWRDRARASIAWATVPALAALLLVVAVETHAFRSSIAAGPHTPLSAAGRVAADAMSVIGLASVALVLLLLVGWALVGRLADRVPAGRAGRQWLMLVTAPIVGGLVAIGLSILRARFADAQIASGVVHSPNPLIASVLSIAWDAVASATLLCTFCVVFAARKADLRVSDLRGGVRLAQLTAAVIVIAAVASVAWGVGVTHQPPIPRADLIGPDTGARPWTGIQASIAAEWPLVSMGLASISAVTVRAAKVARRSYKTAGELLAPGD